MYNGKRWFCLGLLTFVIAVFGPCPRALPLSWIMTTQKEKEKRRKKIFVCIIYTHSNIMHSTEYKYLIYDVILHTSLNHINHIVYVVIEYAQTFRYDLYYSICITALECSVNQHIYISLSLSLSQFCSAFRLFAQCINRWIKAIISTLWDIETHCQCCMKQIVLLTHCFAMAGIASTDSCSEKYRINIKMLLLTVYFWIFFFALAIHYSQEISLNYNGKSADKWSIR